MTLKRCSRCRDEKDVAAFTRDQSRQDGLCPYCRSCKRVKKREHRERHPERLATQSRERQRARAGILATYAAARDRRATNRLRAASQNHRARRAGQNERVTPDDLAALRAAALGICAYCNEETTVTVDHVDPLSRGGEHQVDNMVMACRSCNSDKNQSSLIVWLARRAARRAA